MAYVGYELYEVATDYVTVDLIIWKRYRRKALGVIEKTLADNPQLARVHQQTPFLPVGMLIRVPIDPSLIAGKPQPLPQNSLWTDRAGYTI